MALTKAQAALVRKIEDGQILCREYAADGEAYFWDGGGHPPNPRTVKSLIDKQRLAPCADGLFVFDSQTFRLKPP